jgi:hypothetical protein
MKGTKILPRPDELSYDISAGVWGMRHFLEWKYQPNDVIEGKKRAISQKSISVRKASKLHVSCEGVG